MAEMMEHDCRKLFFQSRSRGRLHKHLALGRATLKLNGPVLEEGSMSPSSRKALLHRRLPPHRPASPPPRGNALGVGHQGDLHQLLKLTEFVHQINHNLSDKERRLAQREADIDAREQRLREAEQRLAEREQRLVQSEHPGTPRES